MCSSVTSEVAIDSSPAVNFGCCLRPCGNHVSCYVRPHASLPAEKSKEICWTCLHLFLSLTIWGREKRIFRAVFPSYFFLLKREVVGLSVYSWGSADCKSQWRTLFQDDSHTLADRAETTNSAATTQWIEDGRKPWIFSSRVFMISVEEKREGVMWTILVLFMMCWNQWNSNNHMPFL